MVRTDLNYTQSLDINIEDITPAMQQYLKIKREYPDAILLYRMGDFYETFFEDAILMSKELEITLTGRDAGSVVGKIPLAGIPAKALDNYLEKLITKDYKVAICEQLEDAKNVKGIVKRGVVRIITAGTISETEYLQKNTNNYICSVFKAPHTDLYGFSYADISTGEFKATQLNYNMLLSELARIQPSEVIAPAIPQKNNIFCIIPEEKFNLPDEIVQKYNCSKVSDKAFDSNFSLKNLQEVFKTTSLDSYGYKNCKMGFQAAGALVTYILQTMKDCFPKFDTIITYELSDFLAMDSGTRKNLELVETLRDRNKKGSLLWAIDRTKTSMGTRLLRSWICQPLRNIEEIEKRQNVVEQIIENPSLRKKLVNILSKTYDIQRLSTRLSNNTVKPADFLSLKHTLLLLPEIDECISNIDTDYFKEIQENKEVLMDFAQILDKTIKEDAPSVLKDGGIIKDGVSGELDYFRDLLNGGEKWLKDFEEQEKEKTGCKFLKVSYNKIFGYYIEISNSNLKYVPSYYIRKQTLTNAERFITEELKKHENDVLSAQSKVINIEIDLFNKLKQYSQEFVKKIREVAMCLSMLDVFLSFASIAIESDYVKPELDNSGEMVIKNGRHPVLEKILPLGTYVKNDLNIKADTFDETQFMILTGPNMAGKSTYMRQNALILVLAQIGSWVPADYAKIGIADRIFTRVGASDDLSLGQSTFMVEMIETANILNSATKDSFILLDEIGRGTSTYDGVAIAWSVSEFIAEKIKARCIFATHYHELNVMTKMYPHIKNYRITIKEEGGEIEFLRKIIQGGASKSYGIQVAKMAGLPKSVVKRSEELMHKMQRNFANDLSSKKKKDNFEVQTPQLNLFEE